MTSPLVELRSDTQTRPSTGMRQAMADAEVGDAKAGEDPTVNRLCQRVADMLGKEAAIYLPSGTMCNQIAYRLYCRQGDEIIMDRTGHAYLYETGGVAALAGAMIRTVDGPRGIFSAAQVKAAIRSDQPSQPRTRLVNIENTCNAAGGTVWQVAEIEAVAEVARAHGLAVYMDGARLLNAVVATGTPARAFAAPCDALGIDFSKGLAAPVGAVLAGERDFIREAKRLSFQFGGGMRQAGIIAAACLFALDHNVERMAEDHANARALGRGIAQIPGLRLDPAEIETNLVYFDTQESGLSAADIVARLKADGVLMGAAGPNRIRAVTHLDVDAAGVERAVRALAAAVRPN